MWLLYYGSKHNLSLDTPVMQWQWDIRLIWYEAGRCHSEKKKIFPYYIMFFDTTAFVTTFWISPLVIIFLLNRGDNDNNKKLLPIDEIAEKWHGKQDLPSTGETKEIIIPGFKTLVLIANSSEQAVNLCNPEENECLFKLTLLPMIQNCGNRDL